MSARRIHRRLTIEELEPRIALGVADIAVVNVQNAPAVLGPGDHATVKLVLDNRGDAPTGPFDVQWYLSEQPDGPTNTSVRLATQTVPNGIQVGQSIAMNEALTMPSSGLTLQRQYYIVAVADSGLVVAESNVANNVGHSTPVLWGISQAHTNALVYAGGAGILASCTESIGGIFGQLINLDVSSTNSISISISGNGAAGSPSSPAQGATGDGSYQVAAGGTSPGGTTSSAQSVPAVDHTAVDGIPIVIAPADRGKFAPPPFIPRDISPPGGDVQNGAVNPASNVSSAPLIPKPMTKTPGVDPTPSLVRQAPGAPVGQAAKPAPSDSQTGLNGAALLKAKPTAAGIVPASISLPAAQTPIPRKHPAETEKTKPDSVTVSRALSHGSPGLNKDGYDWLMPIVERSLK